MEGRSGSGGRITADEVKDEVDETEEVVEDEEDSKGSMATTPGDEEAVEVIAGESVGSLLLSFLNVNSSPLFVDEEH